VRAVRARLPMRWKLGQMKRVRPQPVRPGPWGLAQWHKDKTNGLRNEVGGFVARLVALEPGNWG
jgi:hypothetical protein